MGISILCFAVGLLCLLINNKKVNRLGIFLALLGVSYLAAIRPETSADTQNYKQYYAYSNTITEYSFSIGRTYHAWVEDWYINLCSVFSKNGIDFRVFLFVIAFVINAVSVYSISKLSLLENANSRINLLALLLLYMSNYGFLYSYVVIRGGLSFACGLCGVYLFINKNYIKSIFLIIISIALHNYSFIIVLLILLLLFGPKKISTRTCAISFTILLIFSLLRVDSIFTNYLVRNFMAIFQRSTYFSFSHYLQEASADGIKKGTVLIILQSLYLTYLYKGQIEGSKQLSKYMLVLIVGEIIAVFINNNATARMSNYFTVYQIVLFLRYLSEHSVIQRESSSVYIRNDDLYNIILICGVFPFLNFIYILRYCSII